jgi:hypothetical protein
VGTTTVPIDSIIAETGKLERKLSIPLFHNGKKSQDLELVVLVKPLPDNINPFSGNNVYE